MVDSNHLELHELDSKWALVGPSLTIIAMALLLVNNALPWWMHVMAFCLLVVAVILINYKYAKKSQ